MRNKSMPKPTKLKRMRTASSCTVFQQILHHFSLCMAEEKMKDNNFHMEEAYEAHSMSCLCL